MAIFKYETKADADDGFIQHKHEIPADNLADAKVWLAKEYGDIVKIQKIEQVK